MLVCSPCHGIKYAPSRMQKRNRPEPSAGFSCFTLFGITQLSLFCRLLCSLFFCVLLRLRGSVRSLRVESNLCLGVLLAEFLFLDEQTHNQAERCETRVHDPHGMQAVCERSLSDLLLSTGQAVDELGVRASTASCQLRCDFWAQGCCQARCLCVHLVLVHGLADDDGDGCKDLADEAKGCRRRGNISRLNVCLQCNQWRLEVGSYKSNVSLWDRGAARRM